MSRIRIAAWARDLIFIVGISILLFIALEILARGWYWVRAPGMETISNDVRQTWRPEWRPYVYWRARPGRYDLASVTESGLRRTVGNPEKADGSCDLLVFGGSTVFGWLVPDESTVPSLIQHELNSRGFERIRVVNLGQMGYVSTQELVGYLLYLRSASKPPLGALFLHGFNDIYSALQTGIAGLPQNEMNRVADFEAGLSGRDSAIAVRRVIKELASVKLARGLLRKLGLDARLSQGRPLLSDIASLADEVSRQYGFNLKVIEVLSEEFGTHVLFFWQPTAFDKSTLTKRERSIMVKRKLKWPMMGTLVKLVTSNLRSMSPSDRWRDLSELFLGENRDVYFDEMHLNPFGNQQIARNMVSVMLATWPQNVRACT